MICRLHLSRKCRYLEDCNNVHICRELESKLPANGGGGALGPQHCSSVLQSLRSSTATCVVGNTMYGVSQLACGAVSDTDMHQLVVIHKQSFPMIPLRIVDVRPDELVAATNSNTNTSHNHQTSSIKPAGGGSFAAAATTTNNSIKEQHSDHSSTNDSPLKDTAEQHHRPQPAVVPTLSTVHGNNGETKDVAPAAPVPPPPSHSIPAAAAPPSGTPSFLDIVKS